MAGRKSRPNHLVFVAHPNQGLNLWSAHHSAADATKTFDSLTALLGATKSRVHLFEVPADEGVVGGDIGAAPAGSVVQVTPSVEPRPFKRPAKSDFVAETNKLLSAGNIPIRDADDPVSEGGAFS